MLHVYRSQRAEELVDALAAWLTRSWPVDAFEALPVVVGSRGMERWLRHELATRLGQVASVDFVFPGAAFDGAAAWLLEGRAAAPREAFWRRTSRGGGGWSGAPLELAVLGALRARRGEPESEPLRRYLGPSEGPVGARERGFAGEVARVVERLLRDRPEVARAWSRGEAPDDSSHAWLARLLADLAEGAVEPSPAEALLALERLDPRSEGRSLAIFGLSTLTPGDRRRVAALSKHLELHFFTLAPSSEWWQDIRRSWPSLVGASAEELEARRAHNALLAADGAPSRDLQAWLEQLGYEEAAAPAARREPASLLEAIQRWIDEAGENPRAAVDPVTGGRVVEPSWARHRACESVQIHACHGALRQCEALRDELLRRFAADPSLEPRHVLVMTPDVATHGPLLSAVFARGGGAPPLPLYVADLGLRATNPVAEVLLSVLALGAERVTASGIVSLLSLAPLRARFQIDEEAAADLEEMVVASGMRWAWDAQDREDHAQPRIHQNTVRFGLERLALGVLMPDEGGLLAVDGDGAPLVPSELGTRSRVEHFGRLAELLARVEEQVRALREPSTIERWRARLLTAIDALARVEGKAAWQRAQVVAVLDELLPSTPGPWSGLELDRAAIEVALRGAFELPQRGDRPPTGAITLSAFEPMRSVPFRIIALLGMDDGAFPRVSRPAAWDPFSKALGGEHDRRTIDRHLFLESVLCAREALLLYGTGFEPKRGERSPLSVVASELAELVEGAFGLRPGSSVVEHPLQPWSPRAFAPSAEGGVASPASAEQPGRRVPPTHDPSWAKAADLRAADPRRLGGVERGRARPEARFPEETTPLVAIDADGLASALRQPQKELLGGRLGLSLGSKAPVVVDREPLELDSLEDWALRAQALGVLREGREVDVEAWERRLAGEGTLPWRAGGRRALHLAAEEASEVVARLEALGPRTRGAPTQLSVEVDGVRVDAVAPELRATEAGPTLVWSAASRPSARARLVTWVSLLVAAAAGHEAKRAAFVGHGGALLLAAPAPDAARAELRRLLELRARVRAEVLPLFPTLSLELARAAGSAPGRSTPETLRRLRTIWEGDGGTREGDRDDPWVAALYGDRTIDDLADEADALRELALAVWGPTLDAEAAAREA